MGGSGLPIPVQDRVVHVLLKNRHSITCLSRLLTEVRGRSLPLYRIILALAYRSLLPFRGIFVHSRFGSLRHFFCLYLVVHFIDLLARLFCLAHGSLDLLTKLRLLGLFILYCLLALVDLHR